MMGLPVIMRELRVEAHRPFNYWLRVLGAGMVVMFLGAMLAGHRGPAVESGAMIFGYLHTTLFIGIWIFVPLLTADCLSQEKREGTLGLLFLTRLTPQSVVGAKAFVHVTRALTLMIAMIPALLLPFIMGGIDWHESLIALNLNLAAALFALAAGLCASAWCQTLARTVTLAIILSVVCSCLYSYVFAWGFFHQVTDRLYYATSPEGVSAIGMLLSTGTGALWSEMLGKLSTAQRDAWVWLAVEMLALGMLTLACAVRVCGIQLRESWQQVPASAKQVRFLRIFCEPRFGVAFMRRHLNASLDRNPIGWLHEYSWTARALKWGWLGVFGLADSWLVGEQTNGVMRWRDLMDAQFYLGMALCAGMAASAVSSFRRERQNGILELLVITPLPPGQIIFGRIVGIWRQFFPAALLLVVFWFYLLSVVPYYRWANEQWFFLSSFITVPLIGLYCSLAHRSFVVSFVLVCGIGMVVPYMVGGWVNWLLRFLWLVWPPSLASSATAVLVQLAIAALAWKFLKRDLVRRSFALG